MKFIATQIGARRGYAVPKILNRAGLLERFYTDIAGNMGVGKLLSLLSGFPGIPSSVAKLASRKIPEEIVSRSGTFAGPFLWKLIGDSLNSRDPAQRYRNSVAYSQALGERMVKAGFGEATHVFSMMGECSPVLEAAHQRGLKVVSEVYIVQSASLLLADISRFPDWHPPVFDFDGVRRKLFPVDPLLAWSDFFICPSEAVQDDLVVHCNVPRERTAVVPYGMSPHWLDLEPRTQPGRVLFVGTADLRKGIHYLAMAAEQLLTRGRRYEFRVAGNVSDQVRNQPVCRHLNFLGRVPRDRIHEEFQQADVFVLPSLAEGSAEVTYEALAAGVPLVVTAAAGSVARDGVEGRIVPERDPAALAEAIENIIENRDLRAKLSWAARERAREFTWEKYGERLIGALQIMGLK